MRHAKAFRKLGRTPAHRRALFRNLATSLVLHDRIETTLPKAKELKRIADKLVTLGKKNNLHARRQAMGYLFASNLTSKKKEHSGNKLTAVHKLFEEIAPKFADRSGGYTRVLRTKVREGDKAQMAIIEFVEAEMKAKEPVRKKRKVKKVEKTEAKEEVKKEAKTEKAEPKEEAKTEKTESKKEAKKEAKAEDVSKDVSKDVSEGKPAKEAPESKTETPAEDK